MTTRIIGTGSYLPERAVSNQELAQMVETSDAWIRSRTGIGERRIAVGEGTSDMASKAALRALEQAGIGAEELDIIILATSSPDDCFPSGACQVQKAIGACRAAAFDISAACSGFIFALNTMHSFLKSGIYRTGLVIGADQMSKLTDWTDRSTCVLFGDGAGAAVVRAGEEMEEEGSGGIRGMLMGSDGSRGQALTCKARDCGNFFSGGNFLSGISNRDFLSKELSGPENFIQMDGQEVFKFAVKKVPEIVQELVKEQQMELSDIRYLFLHQANYRICESIARRLDVPMERIPLNMEHYGNTSGASVPILLDEWNRRGNLRRGDKIILAGFGAGLTWGATLLEW